MTEDECFTACNNMLLAMLGRKDLVATWWTGYNHYFGETPAQRWAREHMDVFNYLSSHANGDYS